MADTAPYIFISYARRDGRELALRLKTDLALQGRNCWLDTAKIEGGADWSREIETAIDHCEVLLALLSRGYYDSEVCRAEQGRARRLKKRVIPLLLDNRADRPLELESSNYLDFSGSAHYTEQFSRLMASLAGDPNVFLPVPRRETITNADALPDHYVLRAAELDRLRQAVLSDRTDRRIALTALHGMGGVGKSVLAAALCRDQAVQDAYEDGIIWVKIGREPGNLVDRMQVIGKNLDDDPKEYTSESTASDRLRMLLPQKRALIVLDDVWESKHLQPFIVEAPRCRLLITTRDASLSHSAQYRAQVITLGMLTPAQAAELMRGRAGKDDPAFPEIARRLGYHPLALALAAGRIGKDTSGAEWLASLDHVSQIKLKRRTDDPHENLALCLEMSVNALQADRPLFLMLGIFPEDQWVPEQTIVHLWRHTHQMRREDAWDLLEMLAQLALIEREAHTLKLHDLLHDYNRVQLGDGYVKAQIDLLDVHRPAEGWHGMPPEEPYLWDYFAYHLLEADRHDELRAALLNGFFLTAKLGVRDANALITDCDAYLGQCADEPLSLLKSALAMSGHVLARDKKALAHQLVGRLMLHCRDQPDLQQLTDDVIHITPNLFPVHLDSDYATHEQAGGAILRTLRGHAAGVTGAAWAPDGRRIVFASEDKTLIIWDAEAGELLLTLRGHTSIVNCAAWAPNGQRIASASADGTLIIWEAETGATLLTLREHADRVTSVAWAPNGQRIVSTSYDGTLIIWEAETGATLLTLREHTNKVTCAAWAPDGRQIVSGSWDKTLIVWDVGTGRPLLTLEGHTGTIWSVAWAPNGRRLVSASEDKTLVVWDAETGKSLLTLEGHMWRVTSAAWAPDGQRIISTSWDGTLIVWGAEAGKLLLTLRGHVGAVWSAAWAPNGQRIVSASQDGTLIIWQTEVDAALQALRGHIDRVTGLAWAPDGQRLVSASYDGTLVVWNTETGKPLLTLRGHIDRVTSVAWAPDGQQLVSASYDDTLIVWDAGTGAILQTLHGHSDSVRSVAWAPDGQRLVSASEDGTLIIWDAGTGAILQTLRDHKNWVTSAAWAPDGRRILSTSGNSVSIWDAETGVTLLTLSGRVTSVSSAAWAPDGRRLVSISQGKTLVVWDVETGIALLTLSGHVDTVWSAAWSPNGRRLISASRDKTLVIWDVETGAVLHTFHGDAGFWCCLWSPDGRLVAAGDNVGRVLLLRWVE